MVTVQITLQENIPLVFAVFWTMNESLTTLPRINRLIWMTSLLLLHRFIRAPGLETQNDLNLGHFASQCRCLFHPYQANSSQIVLSRLSFSRYQQILLHDVLHYFEHITSSSCPCHVGGSLLKNRWNSSKSETSRGTDSKISFAFDLHTAVALQVHTDL